MYVSAPRETNDWGLGGWGGVMVGVFLVDSCVSSRLKFWLSTVMEVGVVCVGRGGGGGGGGGGGAEGRQRNFQRSRGDMGSMKGGGRGGAAACGRKGKWR